MAHTLLCSFIQRRRQEERLAKENETIYEKPNNMLQWLKDLIELYHKITEHLFELQLVSNLAEIHTASLTFI